MSGDSAADDGALFQFEPRQCGSDDKSQRYVMRALNANDFHKGEKRVDSIGSFKTYLLFFCQKKKGHCILLGQLTNCGDVTEEMFAKHFAEMKRAGNYHTVVIEDTEQANLVGTATLLTELKFTHACGKVGHIEDVVADSSCRGQGFGKQLVLALVEVARREHCYKVILDASEKNTGFYEKCGFQRRELQMRLDLH